MADLEALKRAAEAATPGPWFCAEVECFTPYTDGGVSSEIIGSEILGLDDVVVHEPTGGFSRLEDAEFSALANPATILDLIFRLEEAEKALEDIRHTLLDIADRLEEEGDRTFLGSTNDGDEIKTIAQNLDARRWADVRRAHAAHKRLKGGTDEG